MNYELSKKLNEAGYPFTEYHRGVLHIDGNTPANYPRLSELIEAVGFCFATLTQKHENRTPEGYLKFSGWEARATDATCGWLGKGETPETAVANLWLNIKNNIYEYHEEPVKVIKL